MEAPRVGELRLGHDARVGFDIPVSGGRPAHEFPLVGAIGIAAVRHIHDLRAKRDAVNQRSPVAVEQADFLAAGAEAETRVQSRVRGVAIRPDQKITARGDQRDFGPVQRKPPLGRIVQIVRQIHSPHVDGRRARVMNLDPVVVFVLRV